MLHHASHGPPPPRYARWRINKIVLATQSRARALPTTTKRIRLRQKEGGGAPKGASNQFRAAPTNVAACRCPGAEARQSGARSPSGATPRLSPGLSHPGSAPGHASWDSVPAGVTRPPLSQSSGSTPRLGRSTEENDAQSRSGADCKSARKHRTRSASESALAKASLDERDSADCNENRDKCQQQSRDIKDSHSNDSPSFLPMASDVATDKLS
jgi:hypothetical protein